MSIAPKCAKCKEELTAFGAVLLSPPNKNDQVVKLHICQNCYDKILDESPSDKPSKERIEEMAEKKYPYQPDKTLVAITDALRIGFIDCYNEQQKIIDFNVAQNISLMKRNLELSGKDNWVDTKDKMPEFDGQYHVFIKSPQQCGNIWEYQSIIGCDNNRWTLREDETVTHWQPLPEPPKKESIED